jgi:hypothetical protein
MRWKNLFYLICAYLFLFIGCAPVEETAVIPTPLPAIVTPVSATTTTAPTAVVVQPTATDEPSSTPQATAVAQESPTATPSLIAPSAIAGQLPDCPSTSPDTDSGTAVGDWRIVYVTGNQVWLLTGGKESVLLAEAERIYAVQLSGDGRLVAFARRLDETNSELWLVADSGTSIRLTEEGGIPGYVRFTDFSDDNRLVAFTLSVDTEYTGDLWVAAADGSGVRRLVGGDELMALADSEPGPGHVDFTKVAWVPGTHLLIYIPYLRYQGDYTQEAYDPLPSVDADTGEQSLFLEPGAGGYVTFSPDGTKMAVARPDRVNVMTIEDKENPLVNFPILQFPYSLFIPQPVWENNSSSVLVTVPAEAGVDPDIQPLPMAVWRLPVDGSPPLPVGQFNGDIFLYSSPDSNTAVYVVPHKIYVEQQWPTEVRLASTDFSMDNLIDNDFGGWNWGGWSPDSRHFVYWKAGSDGIRQLMLGNICNHVTPLTEYSESSSFEPWFVGWLDNQSFLFLHASPQADGSANWELWQGSIKEELILLSVMGQNPIYDWVSEPGGTR